MFERFTAAARNAVTEAQSVARALGDRHIGTEHLLIALLDGDGPANAAMRGRGLTVEKLRGHLARTRGRGGDPLDPRRCARSASTWTPYGRPPRTASAKAPSTPRPDGSSEAARGTSRSPRTPRSPWS
ncbi:Clp protease N-terminal domain-containing protein [Actinomadura sp. J1-007]|uniref:Clp protease N-terminal domain-containing protein n=1 Tax=Actinomadura sp. J1-007 TaxID=2661913 RepID=UPI0019D68BA2|nr:Clp protease N-terminal domain-containing protein [Actinomadura sp. J1-007]